MPVPRTDSGLVHVSGERLLELRIPGYIQNADLTQQDIRGQLQAGHDRPVLLHELYPIVPDLQLYPLRSDFWTPGTTADGCWAGVWRDAWSKYYRPLYSSPEKALHELALVVEPSSCSLGLFGSELPSILGLCKRLKNKSMLMHYLMMTVLQYYLAARNRWMCIRTNDPSFPCEDIYPTFAFMMFRGADWGVKEESTSPEARPDAGSDPAVSAESLHAGNLQHTAQTRSFPLLLKAVMHHLMQQRQSVEWQGVFDSDEIDKFCLEKLKKNFAQAMVCTRFREMLPSNLLSVVNSGMPNFPSRHLKYKPVKFYPHPNHIKMLSLYAKEFDVIERVPQMYCHLNFSPVSRVVALAPGEPAIHIVWKMLMFLPLTDFDKQVQSKFPKPFYPLTLADKEGMYDPVFPDVSMVRLRYCIYVRNETAFAYVPWLFHYRPKPEEDTSPALQVWSHMTKQSPPSGPILFGTEKVIIQPANPLQLLVQSTSALKQQMMKGDLLQEVRRWLDTQPVSVTPDQKGSLEMLLKTCGNEELASALHARLEVCAVVKVEQ